MFDENLDDFFTDFAVDVTLQFKDTNKDDITIKGIFEDPYAAASLGSYRVVATNPVVMTKWTEEVAGLSKSDKALINGTEYIVEGTPAHDGTGIARIMLIEASLTDDQSQYFTDY